MNKPLKKLDEIRNETSRFLMSISDKEFDTIRSIVYEKFGIALTEKKRVLVVGRLQGLLRQRGFDNFTQYCDFILGDKTGNAATELVNLISTNYTYFFREQEHFDFMKQTALPELVKQIKKENSNDIRIWCTACATGEEPYSVQMTLLEYFKSEYLYWKAGVLATDISQKALDRAREGNYREEQLDKVSQELQTKYFKKTLVDLFTIKDQVKKEITFRRFNLMNQVFPFKKPFHLIFCRNVMIYFDQQTSQKLVKRLYDCTAPGGYLFIGHSESLQKSDCPYEFVKTAVYRRKA